MATYIALVNWTEQGIRDVADSPKRLDLVRKLGQRVDVKLKDFYMTMGEYDIVVVFEAPSDAVLAKFILEVARTGNIRTKTLKAFTEAEYRAVIGSLS
ncbi:MAG: GYD domain-containing protein [Dongiaceae bacterium]